VCRLSCAIITKNEERNIASCLQSVSFADELVVVDSGSTDMTIEIAKKFGCRVFVRPFDGFGHQKQYAIERCKGEWILLIDADERVPEETRSKIEEVLAEDRGVSAFGFTRKNFFRGRWMRHGGLWPDRVIRLFKKGRAQMSRRPVHEHLIVDGKVSFLEVPLLHFLEGSVDIVLKKIELYADLHAEEALRRGQGSSVVRAAAHASLAFLYKYIIRLGFLDGQEGLLFASFDAIARFVKYTRLWELKGDEGSTPS